MTDTFKKEYKSIEPRWNDHILLQKDVAEKLEELFSVIKNREMSLAMTHLETAVMWATKAVVLFANKDD
jgi:hypothetical protein